MLFARLLPLLFLLPLSSPVLGQDVKTLSVPKSCTVTRPSEHPFVPPRPYLANGAWFGTDRLWTLLPATGYGGKEKRHSGSEKSGATIINGYLTRSP